MTKKQEIQKQIDALEADIKSKEKRRGELDTQQQARRQQIESFKKSAAMAITEGRDSSKDTGEVISLERAVGSTNDAINLLDGQLSELKQKRDDLIRGLARTVFDEIFDTFTTKTKGTLDLLQQVKNNFDDLEKIKGELSKVTGITLEHVSDDQRLVMKIADAITSPLGAQSVPGLLANIHNSYPRAIDYMKKRG